MSCDVGTMLKANIRDNSPNNNIKCSKGQILTIEQKCTYLSKSFSILSVTNLNERYIHSLRKILIK